VIPTLSPLISKHRIVVVSVVALKSAPGSSSDYEPRYNLGFVPVKLGGERRGVQSRSMS
jgi:hypothetical protein